MGCYTNNLFFTVTCVLFSVCGVRVCVFIVSVFVWDYTDVLSLLQHIRKLRQ